MIPDWFWMAAAGSGWLLATWLAIKMQAASETIDALNAEIRLIARAHRARQFAERIKAQAEGKVVSIRRPQSPDVWL